jgi:hypothetical protein
MLRTGLAIFSAITSFLFVYYAVTVLVGGETSSWLKAFAYVAGGYGLANIYILSWAWRNQADWPMWAYKFFAFSFFGLFIADTLSQGIKGPMEVVGILGLACVLWINWLAIKRLCQSGKD